MRTYDKRELANRVLRLVKKDLAGIESDEQVGIGSFQNGREQGHTLTVNVMANGRLLLPFRTLWVAWAENRNSDDIVVYFADQDPCQGVSEEAYKNARYCRTTEEARDVIVSLIKDAVPIVDVNHASATLFSDR